MTTPLVSQLREHLADTECIFPIAPATQLQVDETSTALGFPLPEILALIYLTIGNGGFGPGRGTLIGVAGGHATTAGTIASQYHDIRNAAVFLGRTWPACMLPFCEWGCNIFSCVDCNDASLPIYTCVECSLHRQSYGLPGFVEQWIEGVDILPTQTAPVVSAEGLNPFTRQKATFYGRRS